MEHLFCSYSRSLALKELGFNEPCFRFQNNISDIIEEKGWVNWNEVEQFVSLPLKQQVFRWFREKYDIHYSIDRECSQHDHKWGYNWSLYNYTGIFDEYLTSHPNAPTGEWIYETYEEAEDACIDKLIELIKTVEYKRM